MIQIVGLIFVLVFVAGCAERKTEPASSSGNKSIETNTPSMAKTKEVVDTFLPVKTLLSRNCAPCHDPGGKMYERLPFDSPQVVRSHSTSILQRLNNQEDKQILESWLSTPES